MKRLEDESFEKYKIRRQADKILTAMKLAPKVVWLSSYINKKGKRIGRTYIKARDTLMNQRKDEWAPKRPAGDQGHNYEDKPKPTKEHPDIEIYQQPLPLGEDNGN